jgi:transposase
VDEFVGAAVSEVEYEQTARVAALDIAKASAMVCTRLPAESGSGRKTQRVWQVGATTSAILELADHLVCQGVDLVVMESTSVYWKPFVRHEALVNRVGVEGPYRWSVAAGW